MSKTEAGLQHLLHVPVFYVLLVVFVVAYLGEKYLGLYGVLGARRRVKPYDPNASFSVSRKSVRGIVAEKTLDFLKGCVRAIRYLALLGLALTVWFAISA
jgi:hypothetical protein